MGCPGEADILEELLISRHDICYNMFRSHACGGLLPSQVLEAMPRDKWQRSLHRTILAGCGRDRTLEISPKNPANSSIFSLVDRVVVRRSPRSNFSCIFSFPLKPWKFQHFQLGGPQKPGNSRCVSPRNSTWRFTKNLEILAFFLARRFTKIPEIPAKQASKMPTDLPILPGWHAPQGK